MYDKFVLFVNIVINEFMGFEHAIVRQLPGLFASLRSLLLALAWEAVSTLLYSQLFTLSVCGHSKYDSHTQSNTFIENTV